ncbi:hypothetical protein [Paraburkholderia caffeinitolerans]|uniref:hypothetical protein n=1 Tax=Paraburkholderia caffeinitolerans TaxID=1723730 RepID=UPI00158242E2|nr:hypothetical protein [Paraburkholderia caffeinitolerans]
MRFAHWHGYDNVSVFARRGWRLDARKNSGIQIVEAQSAHADALRAFLDDQSREQPFGCVFSEPEFARRLRTWPAFGLASFLLAIDGRGAIVGCVAPWDAGAIKRIVLERLPPQLQAIRMACNAIAPALGRPRIAAPGEPLRDVYLTHLQVRERDPAVFAALVDAAWSRVRGSHALMQLCLFDGDPFWSTMNRFLYTRTPMDLYVLQTREGRVDSSQLRDEISPQGMPGFEIYLV